MQRGVSNEAVGVWGRAMTFDRCEKVGEKLKMEGGKNLVYKKEEDKGRREKGKWWKWTGLAFVRRFYDDFVHVWWIREETEDAVAKTRSDLKNDA